MYAARGRPTHLSDRQFSRMLQGGAYLWDHLGEAPVLLIPCQRRPVLPPREALPPDIAAHFDDEIAYTNRIRGASIYPAVQNILLACRALGLGALTGSLTPGKKADLILLRTDALNIAPLNVPAGQIVLAAQPRNVDSVWIDGIARKRGGELVGIDVPGLIRNVKEAVAGLSRRIGKDVV